MLRDPLVENVPRREAELRLEQQHDPEGEEEQPGDEREGPDGERAADARRGVQVALLAAAYLPDGLRCGTCWPSGEEGTRTMRATPSGSHQL